jgi:hypothetical protein
MQMSDVVWGLKDDYGLRCSKGGVENLTDVWGTFPSHGDRLRPLDRVES